MKSAEMELFFGPVVNTILRLVETQLDAERKISSIQTIKVRVRPQVLAFLSANSQQTVILVGGFGDSRYLNNALRKPCEARDIRLICPQHP